MHLYIMSYFERASWGTFEPPYGLDIEHSPHFLDEETEAK